MKICLLAAAAAAIGGLAASAFAGTIVVSDRATVVSALGSAGVTEDFGAGDNLNISTGVLSSTTNMPSIGIVPGYILPNVTYSTAKGGGFFFNIDYGAGFSGGFLDTNSASQALTLTFAAPQTAFGFDTNNDMGSSFSIVINFANGKSFADTLSIPDTASMTGFGFTSSADDIVSAVISAPNSQQGFAIDNVTYNDSPPTVPEPATLAILGAGLAGLGLVRHRRRGRGAIA